MKVLKNFAAVTLLTSSIFSTVSAQTDLFYPETKTVDAMRASSTVINALEANDSFSSIQMIGLNVDALRADNRSINLNFDGKLNLETTLSRTYEIDDESYAWVGNIDLGLKQGAFYGENDLAQTANQALFMVHGKRVFGQINIEGLVYEIRTLEKGDGYIMVQRDFSVLSHKDDTPKESFKVDQKPPVATRMTSVLNIMQLGTTEAARDAGGNAALGDAMRFFITQSNQVYNTNGLDIEVRNAGLFLAGAEPRISSTALLGRLRGTNDGFIDSVPGSLRNQRNADIVVLVTTFLRNGGLCGQADAIGANQSRAFFLVDHDCTDFTFVHEAGHLFGARHDNDPTTSPFRFGHGYVVPGRNGRSVMAVSSNPQPRLGAFSNPNQSFQNVPFGTSNFNDNTRVHRQRAATMAGFR